MSKLVVTAGGTDGPFFHFVNVVPFFFDQDGLCQFFLKFVGFQFTVDFGSGFFYNVGGGQRSHVEQRLWDEAAHHNTAAECCGSFG